MRRNLIILFILILAIILYFYIMRTGPEPAPSGSQLAAAMAGVQATLKEAVLEARVQVPDSQWLEAPAEGELEQLALALLSTPETGAKGRPSRWVTEDGSVPASVASYVLRDETVGLELSIKKKSPGEPPYLHAKATLTEPAMLPDLESRWQQVFHSRGYQPRYSTLLIGTLNGLPTYNEQEMIMAELFQALEVPEPWQVRDGGWVSWGGYSPRLSSLLQDARGERLNVQAALRYHHLEECTYLYLGSPLIYRDF